MTIHAREWEEEERLAKILLFNILNLFAGLSSSSSGSYSHRHCDAFDCPNSKLQKRANPWIGKEKAEAISYL
jgi:hypothetical protein